MVDTKLNQNLLSCFEAASGYVSPLSTSIIHKMQAERKLPPEIFSCCCFLDRISQSNDLSSKVVPQSKSQSTVFCTSLRFAFCRTPCFHVHGFPKCRSDTSVIVLTSFLGTGVLRSPNRSFSHQFSRTYVGGICQWSTTFGNPKITFKRLRPTEPKKFTDLRSHLFTANKLLAADVCEPKKRELV